MQLSERAKQLIPLSRIVSFKTWENNYSESAIAIFQKADEEGHYLTDSDLEHLKKSSPNLSNSLELARLLRDKSEFIVNYARQQVLAKYPKITEVGGDLYPPERAESCWRDFWHFLRCITYGIAGQTLPFTSEEGLKNMQLLYQELKVPLEAMVWGLEGLKDISLQQLNPQQQEDVTPYFDHLIELMKKFC